MILAAMGRRWEEDLRQDSFFERAICWEMVRGAGGCEKRYPTTLYFIKSLAGILVDE